MCSQKIKTREEGSNAVWSLLNACLGHGQSEKELSKKVAQPGAGSELDQWSLEQAYAFFCVLSCGMCDFSSLTRDRTHTTFSTVEFQPLDHKESFRPVL